VCAAEVGGWGWRTDEREDKEGMHYEPESKPNGRKTGHSLFTARGKRIIERRNRVKPQNEGSGHQKTGLRLSGRDGTDGGVILSTVGGEKGNWGGKFKKREKKIKADRY